jgi:hypothetical protein
MAKRNEKPVSPPAVCCPGCHKFFEPQQGEAMCTPCYRLGVKATPAGKPKGKK